jgi:hypothetical protein
LNSLSKIEVPAKYNHEGKLAASPTGTSYELVENALNSFSGLELTGFNIPNNKHNGWDDNKKIK